MKKIFLLMGCVFAVLLAGCGSDTPRSAAEELIDAVKNKDADKIVKLTVPAEKLKSKEDIAMSTAFAKAFLADPSFCNAFKNLTFVREETNGENTVVFFQNANGGVVKIGAVKQQDGTWLLGLE